MTDTPEIDVFDYLDYRAFLRDYYVDRKERRGLSYRSISKRIGLRSSNYFKLVLDAERNLTEEMAHRFAEAIGLLDDSAEYFCELVRFNQSKTSKIRAAAYERLAQFRGYRQVRPLEAKQAEYHSTWYLPAIRELVGSRDFVEDPSWIAAKLRPKIKKGEAARALEVLLDLGLLIRDSDGRLSQGDSLVSTGPEAQSVHVANYHRTMMRMAEASLDEFRAAERDISALTLCLGPDGLKRLKQRLQRFRRELLELSDDEQDPTQVVQLNFQLFPLSDFDDAGDR